jgi:branched-chain amino acid transport system permease protein
VVALVVIAFLRTLNRSQFGEVLEAIRENEERSTFIGFDPRAYKVAAFALGALLCGLSGALKALYDTSTAVSTLDVDTSGDFVVYTIVGGAGTLFGPLVGTAIISYLSNVVSGFSAFTNSWRLIEGVIFVAVIVFLPGGVLGALKDQARARARLKGVAIGRARIGAVGVWNAVESGPAGKPLPPRPLEDPTAREPVLRTANLGKWFGAFAANSEITLSVQPGEMRAVIGPNGAGKTTLFNVLAGTTPPSDGQIYFKNEAMTHLDGPRRVRRGIAKAFQTANIYNDQTVLQNCRLAALAKVQGTFAPQFLLRSDRLSEVDEMAHQALERLDLGELAGRRAGDLSHGDKKRLDIAIALATQPELLLLDEPVAGMSLEEVRKTDALLRGIGRTMTVMIIEHDIDLVMGISDSITVLHQGRVLAQGTPSEIRANKTVQEAYLGGHLQTEVPGVADDAPAAGGSAP